MGRISGQAEKTDAAGHLRLAVPFSGQSGQFKDTKETVQTGLFKVLGQPNPHVGQRTSQKRRHNEGRMKLDPIRRTQLDGCGYTLRLIATLI